ncbi:MAG TPA: methyltransferase domain-containing protein [Actinomycetota bacterium]
MEDWRSYEAVAEPYERIHAPRLAEPAGDLVRLALVEPGSRVLDVGTGTGVAALAAERVGGIAVGLDEALGMLRVARAARPSLHLTAGQAIDLPFRDGTFDAVVGNFVVSHFTKYQTALFDMARVLRPGGRMALSAWADGDDELTSTWVELVETVVPRRILQSSISKGLPWRERFRDRHALQEAMMEAGLRQVRTEMRRYRFVYRLDEYVEGLGTWTTGRFVRSMLGDGAFDAFLARAKGVFQERFADPVNDFREVAFSVGIRP